MTTRPILSAQQLGRRIQEKWIWRNLSFDVTPGMRLGVVGPSGSGKTLLQRALAGLDPLDKGTVMFKDRAISSWHLPDYRAQVVYLPQTPAFAEGTVEENLRLVFAFNAHLDKSYQPPRILQYLEHLGRNRAFLRRSVDVLSGGERQIAAFLRALQLAPSVLLLDEPTANLDAQSTRQIEKLVAAWLEEDNNRAFLWTSHDPAQIQRMTTRQLDLTHLQ